VTSCVEGKTIVVELRNAAGQTERLAELANELLRLKVSAIVAVNTPAVQAAQRLGPAATSPA